MRRVFDRAGWAVAGALAIITVLAVARIAFSGPLDPSSGPGSTPGVRLPGTPIAGPTVISLPGKYYLTGDVGVPSGSNGIVIAADNVTVDLNGFSVVGASGDAGTGVFVSGSHEGAVLRNGMVRNTGGDFVTAGVDFSSATHSLIEHVTVIENTGAGVILGSTNVLEYSVVSANSSDGVVAGSDNVIRYNQVQTNGQDGIQVGGENAVHHNRVSEHMNVNVAAFRIVGHQNVFGDNIITDNWWAFRVDFGQLNTGYRNVLTGIAGANLSAADPAQSFAPFESVETSTNPWANVTH